MISVEGIGEVEPGTDLAELVVRHVDLLDGDVVVVTSKIVSKALGLATRCPKDDVVVESTDRVVARRGNTVIVRTVHGLTLAAGGVDASNLPTGSVLPLPADPDAIARQIRSAIEQRTGLRVGVVITDTAGRAWRIGQTDIAIGCAGLLPFQSFAGEVDSYGNELAVTSPAIADEVAGSAELASGKLSQRPITVIRGLDPTYVLDDDGPGAGSLIRDEDGDLFGLGARDAVLVALSGHPERGFPISEGEDIDVVALADPGDLAVTSTDGGYVIHATRVRLVDAGMLKQRILAIAAAHQRHCTVDVVES